MSKKSTTAGCGSHRVCPGSGAAGGGSGSPGGGGLARRAALGRHIAIGLYFAPVTAGVGQASNSIVALDPLASPASEPTTLRRM
jgi:hypothetical protein